MDVDASCFISLTSFQMTVRSSRGGALTRSRNSTRLLSSRPARRMVMRTQVASSSEQTTHHLDPRRWLMLVVILCATFMGALDTFIVNVAMPTLERELHASWASVQLV